MKKFFALLLALLLVFSLTACGKTAADEPKRTTPLLRIQIPRPAERKQPKKIRRQAWRVWICPLSPLA